MVIPDSLPQMVIARELIAVLQSLRDDRSHTKPECCAAGRRQPTLMLV